MVRKSNNPNNGEDQPCKYHLSRDSNKVTMVAHCMDCRGGAGLDTRSCLTGILQSLSHEFNVDSVILSHYIETKYDEESMKVLSMMMDVIQNFDQMAIREPFEEYFAHREELSTHDKNQQRGTCRKCPLKPEAIFSEMKNQLSKNISGFYLIFNDITGRVAANMEESCEQCIKATESDLVYIFNSLEEFRAFVIHKGFQIVI